MRKPFSPLPFLALHCEGERLKIFSQTSTQISPELFDIIQMATLNRLAGR